MLLVLPEELALVQDLVDQGGFPVVNVGDDGDVAQLGHGAGRKKARKGSLSAWIRGITLSLQPLSRKAGHTGPVVQLDRMTDSGSVGYRFESCRGH